MSENRKKLDAITGLAAVGSSVATVASFIATIVAFLSEEFIATRVCLAVAALSFGLLASTVFLGTRPSYHKPQGS
jgi:hypothetical protein